MAHSDDSPHRSLGAPAAEARLPRVMRLRDVVFFNITAVVGLRWLTTAAQFGPASLGLWILALVIFFLPSAAAVRELTDIDPGAGGLYRWVSRAFGPRHGFIAGWAYWVTNLVYFPSLLVATAAIAAYAGGPRGVHLEDTTWFVGAVSLVVLWLAVGLNVVGLRVGKWLPNAGAYGTWVPAAIFVGLATWSLVAHGSATQFAPRHLVPERLDLGLANFFATMTFAYAGLELAPTLGAEIQDPVATLRRGVVVSGVAVVAMYLLGTVATLVALPAQQVSITNGMPQATAALVARLGTPGLAPAAAIVAVLLVIGNGGGIGAWLAGSARLPFAAGVDLLLPPAFARVHPKWQTPWVALLVQGGLATVFVVAGLIGASVRDAYVTLTSATIVLSFIPYLYVFGSYLRLQRRRTLLTVTGGWTGLAAVALSIALSFIPPAVGSPIAFELKVGGGVTVLLGVGVVLAARNLKARGATVERVP